MAGTSNDPLVKKIVRVSFGGSAVRRRWKNCFVRGATRDSR